MDLLSNSDYTLEEQLSKLNEQSVEDEFCDVSKSVDDAAGMFNKTTATAIITARAAAGPLISFMLNASKSNLSRILRFDIECQNKFT